MSPVDPYKRTPRLSVKDKTWHLGDVVKVGSVRWAIRVLTGVDVVLVALNAVPAKAIRWTTTLDKLPTKEANR